MKITKSRLKKIIKEELEREDQVLDYQDVKKEYEAVLNFLKKDILKKVGKTYVASALDFLANDIRDGLHEADPYDKDNWAHYDSEPTGDTK